MTLTAEKATEINRAYLNGHGARRMRLNVGTDGHWSDRIYAGNWQVCKLEELSDLIEELNDLKQVITEQTGVVL